MNRKILSYLLVISLIISIAGPSIAAQVGNLASDIHFNSTVVDSHNDTMMRVIDSTTWLPKIDISGNTDFHIDIPKLHEGGLNVPFFAAFTAGYHDNTPRSVSRTLALINALYWTEEKNPEVFKITTSFQEIEEAVADNKIAAVPTIEGGYSLDESNAIELVNQYYDLGIRAIGFTWNTSNALGEGANRIYADPDKTPSEGGLTKLGEEVVKEMNKLGMIVDVSHMAESTFWDVINISEAPIIASHSGMHFLRNHQRNLTDNQLKALAKNGGVVGVVFYPEFLTYGYADGELNYIKDYVDHIDYAVNLIGINHVGIGSDFDGGPLPADIKDSSELYKVTEELVQRGYEKDDIEKLLGKNTLRVLKEVEKLSKNCPNTVGQDLKIRPLYRMGEIVPTSTPKITAKILRDRCSKIEDTSFRVIVDGIPYEPEYNKETSILSLELTEALKESFHVVTFEIKNKEGRVQRETRIFYVYEETE